MQINDVFVQHEEVKEILKGIHTLEDFEKLNGTKVRRGHLNQIDCLTIRHKNILVYVDRETYHASDSVTVYDEQGRVLYDDELSDLKEWSYSYDDSNSNKPQKRSDDRDKKTVCEHCEAELDVNKLLDMQEVFVLYSCNAWKNWDSMSLIGVFTGDKLIDVLKEWIATKDFKWGRDIEDIDSLSVYDINSCLEYGHIEQVLINEVQ